MNDQEQVAAILKELVERHTACAVTSTLAEVLEAEATRWRALGDLERCEQWDAAAKMLDEAAASMDC